MPRGNLFSEPI